MSEPVKAAPSTLPMEFYQKSARNFYFAIPLYALIPVLFWWGFRAAGTSFVQAAFWYGALGWFIAMVLRVPVVLAVKKWPKKRMEATIIASSGPLEEGVRLILLLALGTSLPWAASLGQGWAAIEILYTLIAGIVRVSLLTRTDEKAEQAKALLDEQFGSQEATTNPLWGLGERLFASALHIGNALLIAFAPWLVVFCMVEHSALNYAVVRWVKTSAKGAQSLAYIVGTLIFATGLAVWYL